MQKWSHAKIATVSLRVGTASLFVSAVFWIVWYLFATIPEASVTIGSLRFTATRMFDPLTLFFLTTMLAMLYGKIMSDKELVHGILMYLFVGMIFWTFFGAILIAYGIQTWSLFALAVTIALGIWYSLFYAEESDQEMAKICGAILGLSCGLAYGVIHGFLFGLVLGISAGTFGVAVSYPVNHAKEFASFAKSKIKAWYYYILGEDL